MRLDPDNNPSIDPVLDADIKELSTDKEIKKGSWHHTEKKYDPQTNSYMYKFKFEDLQLQLNFAVTYQLSTKSNAMIINDTLKHQLVKSESQRKNNDSDS